MGRPKKGERVTGPYRVEERFRLTFTVADGDGGYRKIQKTFDTEQDALDAKAGFEEAQAQSEVQALSIKDAIKLYIEAPDRPKLRPGSLQMTRFALERFFPDQEAPLSVLLRRTRQDRGPKQTTHAALLYQTLIEAPGRPGYGQKKKPAPLAAATHRGYLKRARTFTKWCVEQGYLPSDPLAGVKLAGTAKAGKPQMSRDDAKRWTKTARELIDLGDEGALAALLALLLGVRQSEISLRRVGDLDNVAGPGPMILRIPFAKTEKGVRDREIPSMVDAALRRHIAGRAATEWLFYFTRKNGEAAPHQSDWMRYHVRRICRKAGVNQVCTHSLRGLHALLALKRGMSPHQVADELGHESFATTREHYLAPGSFETAQQAAVTEFLEGGGEAKLLKQLADRGLAVDKNGNLVELHGVRGSKRGRSVSDAAKKRRKHR